MSIMTGDAIIEAQRIIDRAPPGAYELRQPYGVNWNKILSSTSLGADFKRTVDGGPLNRIKVKSLNTCNHHPYEIS